MGYRNKLRKRKVFFLNYKEKEGKCMLVFGPLLDAVITGSILLLLTVTLRMLNTPGFVMMIPVILIDVTALVLLYWSYAFIRGFEGMGVAFLSIFLLLFSIPSWFVANKKRKTLV